MLYLSWECHKLSDDVVSVVLYDTVVFTAAELTRTAAISDKG